MNKTQSALLTTVFAISSIFAMKAQSNEIAMNVNSTPSTSFNKKSVEPVRQGDIVQAAQLSADKDMIVIYITGGKGKSGQPEPLTAKEYAERLVEGFKDPKYTKYPTDIAVRYVESGNQRPTGARIFINGQAYKTAKGFSLFTPAQIGSNIDLFTSKHAKINGIAATTDANGTQQLASNNNYTPNN